MSERGIGLIFFVNTLVIVILQLPVTKHQEGRRRMVAFAGMAALWAAAWLLVLAGGLWLEAAAAAVAVRRRARPPRCARRVPPRLGAGAARHRPRPAALARPVHGDVHLLVGDRASSSGRPSAGIVLQLEPYALWPIAAGACAVSACWSLLLERRLPSSVLRTPAG